MRFVDLSYQSKNNQTEFRLHSLGSPEQLKYNLVELWSRQIDKKNRIIYQINNQIVAVFIISARGHYGDK